MSGKVWNYVYNSENQMTEAHYFEGPTKLKSVSFFYDALGRRVKKAVEDFQTGNTYARKYAYDSHEIIAELDEDNNVLATYTHSGLRTDDVLSAEITSSGVTKGLAQVAGTYMYLKDGLGSVQAITTESGQLVQRYIYSSFGKLLKIVDAIGMETTAIKTAFTYTNREIDEETGLYYYRARYYDAHSGRFMQVDPDSGYDKSPNSHSNKYIYVLNNPSNMADPKGELAWWVIPLAVGLINAAKIYMEASDVKGASDAQIFGSTLLGFGAGFGAAAAPGGWLLNSLYVGAYGFLQNAGNQLIWNKGTNNYSFDTAFTGAAYTAIANALTFGTSKWLDVNFIPGSGILFNEVLGAPGDAAPSGVPKRCSPDEQYSYSYTEGSNSQNQLSYYYCN